MDIISINETHLNKREKLELEGCKWFGQGYLSLSFRYAFPLTVAKWTHSKEKIENFILFFMTPRLCNISGTTGATKMVHLSKFSGFHKENSQKTVKGPTQKIQIQIGARLKK